MKTLLKKLRNYYIATAHWNTDCLLFELALHELGHSDDKVAEILRKHKPKVADFGLDIPIRYAIPEFKL